MNLFLIRHGMTDAAANFRFAGHTDVSLNGLGHQQARALSERLQSMQFDAIISSDLQRARDTAQYIATKQHMAIETDPRLREMSFGTWEGLQYNEIQETDAELLHQWETDPLGVHPPQGESGAEVQTRILAALAETLQRFPEGNVIWVSHGGIIRNIVCHFLAISLGKRWQLRCLPTSITEFEIGKLNNEIVPSSEIYAILNRLNDVGHYARITT